MKPGISSRRLASKVYTPHTCVEELRNKFPVGIFVGGATTRFVDRRRTLSFFGLENRMLIRGLELSANMFNSINMVNDR